ncbi:3D-(3,5/4)-trihydroxycyclohexane-1,2-dione acylhydrolase (decyclizing), partial [Nonomuraea angiospora]
ATVLRPESVADLRKALEEARSGTGTTVIYVRTDPMADDAPSSEAWWDVPVAEVGGTAGAAREAYEESKRSQHPHLTPPD